MGAAPASDHRPCVRFGNSYVARKQLLIMNNIARVGERASTGPSVPGSRNHYALGAVGLVVAVLVVFLTYSLLVGVANVVPLLSTTVVTFVGVVTWLGVWMTLDVAHDRYVRRKRASAE